MTRIMRKCSRRGTMVVSAAIMFPFLIFLTLAMVEYGWIFIKVQQIRNAARHGARVGARIDSEAADVQAAVDALMNEAGISVYTTTISPLPLVDLDTGDALTVTVDVPYDGSDVERLDVPLIPVPANLIASVSMAREGT